MADCESPQIVVWHWQKTRRYSSTTSGSPSTARILTMTYSPNLFEVSRDRPAHLIQGSIQKRVHLLRQVKAEYDHCDWSSRDCLLRILGEDESLPNNWRVVPFCHSFIAFDSGAERPLPERRAARQGPLPVSGNSRCRLGARTDHSVLYSTETPSRRVEPHPIDGDSARSSRQRRATRSGST